jgi:hypothetical protein
VEARQPVHAVAIEQRERGVSELGGPIDERFRQRRALQKTERGRCVELDVHGENLEWGIWNLECVR